MMVWEDPSVSIVARGVTRSLNAPNRVGRVTSPGRIGSPKVVGRVGEVECEMTIDSGALITMVRADLVRVYGRTGHFEVSVWQLLYYPCS